jgi:F-type H+-transporting ATPase subunit b
MFMKKFLFGKLGVFMQKRAAQIEGAIEKGDSLRREGEALLTKYEDMLESAKDEGKRIIDGARARAASEYDKLIAEAKKDASIIITKAREDADRREGELLREIKEKAASLAIAAASKVLEANMDSERNRELVERFLHREGVAS